MNKKCARCDKTVYPIEELKCLDKLWHKQCFKCQSCGMTLNMRNYKGFNKDPYCEAHIPKAKATSVAETPELKRIAENTKIQSNVKYHADFEKTKGKLTQVADDPETLRLKQNSQIQSNVAYHGDLKKKAEMEQKRTLTSENGQAEENSNHQQMVVPPQYNQTPKMVPNSCAKSTEPPRSIIKNSPYSARQSSTLIYSSNKGQLNANSGRSVGSIADLDPVNHFYGSLNHPPNSQSAVYHDSRMMPPPNSQSAVFHDSRMMPPPNSQSAVYHDSRMIPPPNSQSAVFHDSRMMSPPNSQSVVYHDSRMMPPPKQEMTKSGNIYRAMYDYDARESDEVSFLDGDIILNCTHIHDGWMSGVVQRTGQCGLLPANYVESIII